MKRLLRLMLLVLLLLPSCVNKVQADSYIKTSTTSLKIQKGYKGSFKIKLSEAAGIVSVKSSDSRIASASLSSNIVFLDDESATCYISGIKNGSATITVNYTIAYYDDVKDYSGTLKVYVTVYTPEVVISEDSSIGSIKINNQLVEPDEDEKYRVYLPLNTTTFDLVVTPNSESAKVNDFNVELHEGFNDVGFSITAEDGSSSDYNVIAYVDEKPTVNYLDNTVGVVKNIDRLICPEGFSQKYFELPNGQTIPIFNHQDMNLLYLMDEQGDKDFYLFDKVNNEVLGKYSPIHICGHNYIKVDYDETTIAEIQGLNSGKIYVNDIALKCYYFKDDDMKDFCLVYLMNDKGATKLYCYDLVEGTIQRYKTPIKTNMELVITIAAAGIVATTGVVILAVIIANSKKKN